MQQLATGETNTSVTESLMLTGNVPSDLLNISPGAPGYVSAIWLVVHNLTAGLDGIVKVYVDGEVNPSVEFDLGSLMGHGTQFLTNSVVNVENVSFSHGPGAFPTYFFGYEIPYSSSIRITLTSPIASYIWSSVAYVNGVSRPYRLRSAGKHCATQRITVTPQQQEDRTVKFLELPSGKSGWVVYHHIMYLGATNWSFLENNVVAYLNGLQPGPGVLPQFDSSGTEDYFTDAAYFQNGLRSNRRFAISYQSTVHLGYALNATINLLAAYGGLKFSDGILLTLERGIRGTSPTPTTSVEMSYRVFWYEDIAS